MGVIQNLIFGNESKTARRIPLLSLLLFFLCVAYVILRNLKDAVILTAGGAGAEVIPFLKVWGMLPASCLMAFFFAFLSRHLKRKTLFYTLTLGFLSYYLLFCFVLFPGRELFRLESFAETLKVYLPNGWRGFIQMVEFWPASTFYIMSELWATVIVNVLFWGIVNESMNTDDSRRFFGQIKFGGTISAFCGGLLGGLLTSCTMDGWLSIGKTTFEQTLVKQTVAVTVLVALSCILFYFLTPIFKEESKKSGSKKVKMGLFKAIKYVSGSSYLISLAMCVLGYNLVFNLADVLWKQEVAKAYPNPNDLMSYMNTITVYVGLIAVISVLCSGWVVRRLGWTTLALFTPAAILLTSVGFFSLYFSGFGTGAVPYLLAFGAIQNCLAKALKYSSFDVSKELAFVPLEADVKWNAKAAIDGIGNDVGKTGASLAYQGLLIVFGSMQASSPYVAVIVLLVLGLWLLAVKNMGASYEQSTQSPVISA